MRKVIVLLGALALLCTVLVAGAQAGKQATVVKLKFATYVWQPTTVAANKQIVDSWNKAHPGIQVEIVPVDVNSVHDKLLTSFVGGTAADIIHDEAADIAGFTQQGYLANLTTPSIPTYCASRSGSVVRSGLSRMTSARKNSFQAVMNAKRVVTTMPGSSSGAMIPVRIWSLVAPSTVAASSRSGGIPRT